MTKRWSMIALALTVTAVVVGCSETGNLTGSQNDTAAPTTDGRNSSGGGKPKPGSGTGTLTLVMTRDANGNGLPNWADSLTWNVSTTATAEPHVDLTCKQNGVVVYGATTGFFASYPWPWTQTMTLMSTNWQGGAASCTGTLYYFSGSSNVVLATTAFTANP